MKGIRLRGNQKLFSRSYSIATREGAQNLFISNLNIFMLVRKIFCLLDVYVLLNFTLRTSVLTHSLKSDAEEDEETL